MTDKSTQVLLPFAALPTTDGVRAAIANVIRDIQREHDLTDLQLASRIEVHVNTIERARNKKTTLDNEAMARLGAVFGPDAMRPYTSLWERESGADTDPMSALAIAMAAIAGAKSLKAQFDCLPAVKDAIESLATYASSIERKRLRAVS